MKCNYCNGTCTKKGFNKRVQKYKCKDCSKWQQVSCRNRKYTKVDDAKITILNRESVGISSISRILAIPRTSVQRRIKKESDKVKTPVCQEIKQVYEMDELHTFIGRKSNKDQGFYTANTDKQSSADDRNIDDIAAAVTKGEIKFEPNAYWVFGTCNCANPNPIGDHPAQGHYNIAEYTAYKLGIITYGATDKTFPIDNNKRGIDHGGKFYKFTPIDISFQHYEKVVTTKRFLGFATGKTVTYELRTKNVRYIKKEEVSNQIDVEKIIRERQNASKN